MLEQMRGTALWDNAESWQDGQNGAPRRPVATRSPYLTRAMPNGAAPYETASAFNGVQPAMTPATTGAPGALSRYKTIGDIYGKITTQSTPQGTGYQGSQWLDNDALAELRGMSKPDRAAWLNSVLATIGKDSMESGTPENAYRQMLASNLYQSLGADSPFYALEADAPAGGATATPGKVQGTTTDGSAATPPGGYPNPFAGSTGAPGTVGAGGQLESAITQALMGGFAGNPYLSNAIQSMFGRMSGQIDDAYDERDRQLQTELARTGILDSTFGKSKQRGLNVDRRTAKIDLGDRLLENMGTSMSSERRGNISDALSFLGLQDNRFRDARDFDFNKSLAIDDREFRNSQAWQQFLAQLLGYGTA